MQGLMPELAVRTKPDADKRIKYTISLDPVLLKSLQDLSAKTEIPLSKLTDRAIRLLLKSFDEPPTE